MMNDIRVISSYAPYIDAMFVDNECAAFLREEPLRSEGNLPIRAKIYSLNTKDDLLAYLRELEVEVPPEIKRQAVDVYGVED